jgi:hypothetical protein
MPQPVARLGSDVIWRDYLLRCSRNDLFSFEA